MANEYITIIAADGLVATGSTELTKEATMHLDFSDVDFPSDEDTGAEFWALQWQNGTGWIEFNSPLAQNEEITVLPAWVQDCIDLKEADDLAAAEAAAAQEAADAAAAEEQEVIG